MDQDTIEYTYSDAWLFVCLCELDNDKLDFPKIISVGDAINHAIFMPEEMKIAFIKLQLGGCILIAENNENIVFSEECEELKWEVKDTSNWKVIDFTRNALNSSYNKVKRERDQINDCEFITDKFLTSAYKEYKKSWEKMT